MEDSDIIYHKKCTFLYGHWQVSYLAPICRKPPPQMAGAFALLYLLYYMV